MALQYPNACGAGDIMKVDGQGSSYFSNATDCKVGIGTSIPGAALEVIGEARFGTGISYASLTNRSIKAVGGDMYYDAPSNANHRFTINEGSDIVRFTNAGNVGIGTTNPSGGHLQVEGNKAAFSGYFYNTNTSDGDGLRIRTDYQSVNSILLNIENAGTDLLQVVGGTSGIGKVLVPNGNVGIGTTSPSKKLEVVGDALVKGDDGWDGPGDEAILVLGDTNHNVKSIYGGMGTTGGLVFQTLDASDHVFRFKNSNGTDLVYIKADTGYVGIGTTNPGVKLAVNGVIEASSDVKIGTLTVPDYVFEQDYKLRSLEETKQFIAQHKHLPDVPSATEYMDAGGVMIGKLNELLLRKIEELTLHLIGQEERIRELEAARA